MRTSYTHNSPRSDNFQTFDSYGHFRSNQSPWNDVKNTFKEWSQLSQHINQQVSQLLETCALYMMSMLLIDQLALLLVLANADMARFAQQHGSAPGGRPENSHGPSYEKEHAYAEGKSSGGSGKFSPPPPFDSAKQNQSNPYEEMFKACGSKEEAKRLFREHAMKTHPDKGGDSDDFFNLRSAYNQWNSVA
jgi:hypothetical protein